MEYTMKKRLWHTACIENNCEEFSRTKTLGYGGDFCDFHFYKK